jgi:hypothetical protein
MKKSTCFGLLALTFATGLITAKVLSKYDHTSDSSDPLGIIEEGVSVHPCGRGWQRRKPLLRQKVQSTKEKHSDRCEMKQVALKRD